MGPLATKWNAGESSKKQITNYGIGLSASIY